MIIAYVENEVDKDQELEQIQGHHEEELEEKYVTKEAAAADKDKQLEDLQEHHDKELAKIKTRQVKHRASPTHSPFSEKLARSHL